MAGASPATTIPRKEHSGSSIVVAGLAPAMQKMTRTRLQLRAILPRHSTMESTTNIAITGAVPCKLISMPHN